MTAAPEPRLWTEDLGEISGVGRDNPGYEAACRRMVMAAAEWLAAHPEPAIGITRIPPHVEGVVYVANWEQVFSADTPHAHELLQAMHRAACADQGDDAGPSALMMEACLNQARYIARHGWDAYVAERRRIAKATGGTR